MKVWAITCGIAVLIFAGLVVLAALFLAAGGGRPA